MKYPINDPGIIPKIVLLVMLASPLAWAAPPDLTAGGVPNNTRTINLGPTGMRGWVYHVNGNGRTADTSEARQIQVQMVDSGSPAAGVLAANDVILGADGTGAAPAPFSSDARRALAQAIADAEARNPATLKLLRWRSGTTTTVTITLQFLGAYSATAPYNCPKSAEILRRGLAAITANNETAGRYSFGTLGLIAAHNPADPANAARLTRAQNEARAKVPSASTRAQMMSDSRDASSMITWERCHTLIMLAEYYLFTRDSLAQPDSLVLPGIEAYAVNIAKNTSLFGTVGHIYAYKYPDGSANGPLGGVYGAVNSTGVPCFLGLVLARECLPADSPHRPVIDAAITRSSRFFAYYANKGAIPYGEHEPQTTHEGNGRNGAAAIGFSLLNDRVPEARYFAKSAAAAPSEREQGHTGAFFHYLWAPLGAAIGGEEAAALHFSRIRWMLDLNRRWNGLFAYDCLNGEGPNSGATYNDFRMSTAALLAYALPLRQLRITGKSPNSAHQLSAADIAEAAAADTYSAAGRSNDDLIADTASFSPKTRRLAAIQLGTNKASITTAQRNQLHSTATNTTLPAVVRAGACDALGRIGHSSSAPILGDLLSDPSKYVQYAAAEALRYLPSGDRDSQLTKILQAAATNARPLFPLDDEDPLQFDHGRLAMLLFYNGSAYGPQGILASKSKFDSVNRELLYGAIRAVAQTPIGISRSTVATVYPWLNQNDLNAVAGPVVDAVRYGAPSDRMFSFTVRQEGLKLLERYSNAEGVPAGLAMLQDVKAGERTTALQTLEKYAASYRSITPEPDVPGVVSKYLNNTDGSADQNASIRAAAQAVLDAINADTNPRTLIPFKRITSLAPDHPQIALPATSTVLRLSALDYAEGDSRFMWSQVSGPGTATFGTNGTAAAAQTTVTFPATPGLYRFAVKMADSRGLTEVSRTMDVEVFTEQAALPENDTAPPVPNPMDFEVPPAATGTQSVSMSAVTAFDLNGVEYFFECTGGGGPDSGWQDSPTYEPSGLIPATTYSFRVKARDKSNQNNETGFSATFSATTLEPSEDGIWIFDGGDNWSNSTRWLDGLIANGKDRTANFTANLTGDRTVTLDTSRTLGHIVFTDSTTSSHNLTLTGGNPLRLDVTDGSPTINVTQSGRMLLIQHQLTGSKGLIKNGPGNLNLRASNSYTGDTIINGGILFIGGNATADNVGGTLGGGNYAGNIHIANGALLSVRSSSGQNYSGVISGTGNLFVGGGATLTLSGENTFDGTVQVAPTGNGVHGRLTVSSFNSVFTNPALGTVRRESSNLGAPTTVAKGTITLGQSISGNVYLTYTGSGETTDRTLSFQNINNSARSFYLSNNGSGLLKFTTTPVGVTTSAHVVLDGTANGELVGGLPFAFTNFTKQNSGMWTLGGAVKNTGTLSVTGGILSLRKRVSVFNDNASNWTPVKISVNSGATLALGVGDSADGYFGMTELATFLDGSHMGASTASTGFKSGSVLGIDTTNANGGTFTYSGVLGNMGTSANNGLAKLGAGTLILDQTNTYSGATTIAQGNLGLGVDGSIADSSSILIEPLGTLDTTAKPAYSIPTGQPLVIGINPADGGSSGKIVAQTLNITNAAVTFSIEGVLDDPAYILATYTTLQGGAFSSVPTMPEGYVLDYNYEGNKIALVQFVSTPGIAVEQPVSTVIANGGSVDFGTVTTGADASLVFTIRSTGNADLELTGSPAVEITGTHTSDFTVTENPATSLTPGGSTTFTLRFAPSGAGARSASLSITNNSEDSPLTILLGGTGQTPYAAWSGGAPFDGDANGDGVANSIAWVLGAAGPNDNAIALLPTLDSSDPNDVIFTFRRRDAAHADSNTNIVVKYGSDLTGWTSAIHGQNGITIDDTAIPQAGFRTVVVRIPKALALDERLFAHLEVSIAP